jgi:hypothetical protein
MSEPNADRALQAPAVLLARRLRIFASPAGQPRSRRATDLVLLLVALAGLIVVVAAYPPSGFEESLERFLASIPGWLSPLWGFLADLTWLFAILLIGIALVRRRVFVAMEAVASLVAAALLGVLAARLAIGSWPGLWDAIFGTASAPRFPGVRLAEAVAVIVCVSPNLVRPWRRLGRWVLVLGVVGTAVVGGGTPLAALAAVLIGVVARGAREGTFEVPDARRAAVILATLLQDLNDALADELFVAAPDSADPSTAERIVTAHLWAIERVLGVPDGSTTLLDAAVLLPPTTPAPGTVEETDARRRRVR